MTCVALTRRALPADNPGLVPLNKIGSDQAAEGAAYGVFVTGAELFMALVYQAITIGP
jgi:hypothetical protein